MDFVRYVIQEIHAFMFLIRILLTILPTLTTLYTLHTRLTWVIPVETILILVLLRVWDRVFKIKDALRNKQNKPEDTQELFRELFNDLQNIHEELAEYINTPGWNRPAFYNNGDDDDEECTIAITSDFLITNSLSMGDEHLDTILEKESDEFNKSSVEDLVPNLSEFEDECECDVPNCDDSQTTNFSTFSNPLFDDSTSSDDESSHEEVIHEMSFKTYSNPLFDLDEEIISSEFNPIYNKDLDSTLKNDRFDTDSYLLESSLNPNCDTEKDNHLVERLLYDNSSPRPPKEFVYENYDADIESFSPSPIPNEDSESQLPSNYSFSLPVNESFYFDISLFSRPPAKPPDGNTGILNIKMMGDNSNQKVKGKQEKDKIGTKPNKNGRRGNARQWVHAWDEVVEKVMSRLSRWKMKTLSIVPTTVLHSLENIRSRFFKGHDLRSAIASWVKWSNVLTPIDNGGLGVSSLYALNRGLLLKWMWKFFVQKTSLWTRVIKAIHGVDRKVGQVNNYGARSCWTNIVSEVEVLKQQGVNFFDYLQLNVGNGDSINFWEDRWLEGAVLKDKFPRLYALETNVKVSVGAKLKEANLDSSFPRGGIEQV
uniref:RNA-directed DNA polymerase, eukaryota, reverse transcriptase zinc-binding domain protein n=1 Tax=Tanacetum cinerariifolium TaxID=118510 RepID=A0A699HGL9_TANCI|nr:RNA-directed DNA polymerase, eukaryota, reverse transcriptase zinc-binding domain protein [Tanacetum cinerariifolium]